jgi:predicted ferric reductase
MIWYLMRGSGVVTLLLFTAVAVLGIATSMRWRAGRLPRFVTQGLHRNVSLLAVVFLVIHVATALLDSYAHVRLAQVFAPLPTRRYGLFLGLGTLSLDLLLAIVVTSLVRHRLARRVWKGIHWLAYASWPVAFVHGVGMGTDRHLGWFQVTALACLGAVAAATGWRLAAALRRPYPKYLEART